MLDSAVGKPAAWEPNVQASLMLNPACVAGGTCGPHPKCDTPCRSYLVVQHPGKCFLPGLCDSWFCG